MTSLGALVCGAGAPGAALTCPLRRGLVCPPSQLSTAPWPQALVAPGSAC